MNLLPSSPSSKVGVRRGNRQSGVKQDQLGRELNQEETMRAFMKSKVRPLALSLVAPTAGFLLLMLLELLFDVELSKLVGSLVNLIVVAPIAFLFFPRVLGIPFGRVGTGEFLKRVGFSFPPEKAPQHARFSVIELLA